MKSFTVYSKQNIASGSSLTINEVENIRLISNGVRLFFLFDITGIIYSFYRRMYTLGIFLIIWFILLIMIKYIFDVNVEIISSISISVNLMLVIFGREIEEFILKRRGFKVIAFETARNINEAAYRMQQKIRLKL